jgi:hypothetical protein
VGSEVQVVRQDGGLVEGTLAARTPTSVKIDTGTVVRLVDRDDIADVRLAARSVAEVPPEAKFQELTIPAQTRLHIRLSTRLSSETSRVEDRIRGELTAPVVLQGIQVIPAGATALGVVTKAIPSGHVKGRARLVARFDTLVAGDDHYAIRGLFDRTAPATKRKDAEKIAVPAAGGAIVGAIVGGVGAAVVLSTPGAPVALSPGAIVSVTVGEPVTVRVPID